MTALTLAVVILVAAVAALAVRVDRLADRIGELQRWRDRCAVSEWPECKGVRK